MFREPIVHHVFLDKIKVACMARLSKDAPFIANHAQLRIVENMLADDLTVGLISYALGKRIDRIDVVRKWPADWWQAFKERWAPEFLLRRFPVRYETLEIHRDVLRVCPHVNIKTQDGGDPVHFTWLENGDD